MILPLDFPLSLQGRCASFLDFNFSQVGRAETNDPSCEEENNNSQLLHPTFKDNTWWVLSLKFSREYGIQTIQIIVLFEVSDQKFRLSVTYV